MKTNTFNVLKYGAINDGKTLSTVAVQKCIDEASNQNGIIYFPQGEYVLSTLYLRNNTSIFFAKDVKILGSLNFYDFERDEKVDYPLYQDESHSFFHSSLFVAEHVNNIKVYGNATIDMRSVWDEDNVRHIVHRGCKAFALKECKKILITDINVLNVTDLGIYFAGCEKVTIRNVSMRVYIDGISPDNSKKVLIENCDIEAGDDAIVLKSSYTLNRIDECNDITIRNCRLKSRCNAIKFGTESNGGFKNIKIHGIQIYDTRITGISLETVDGAIVDNVSIRNINMTNVGTPLFVHIGKRLRGPEGISIGSISNVSFENITAKGPYKLYNCIAWNYVSYLAQSNLQFPGVFSKDIKPEVGTWQITSNICGLPDYPIKNISFKNIDFELDGGVQEYSEDVTEEPCIYPEVNAYGKILPASGLFFRHIDGLSFKHVNIKLLHKDARPKIVLRDVIMKQDINE